MYRIVAVDFSLFDFVSIDSRGDARKIEMELSSPAREGWRKSV